MKFIRLELLNLASLDRPGGEVIDFDKGALGSSSIFSIVGPTGSGKSTILDAICLALYNRAPRYPRRKGEKNQKIEIYGDPEEGEANRLAPTDSRNILTRGKKEAYSKLTFLANNGTLYRAEWSVRKKNKNYENALTQLFKISRGKNGLSEEEAQWDTLPQIIGLDYEQFLRTVLIAQGSFSSFVKAKENERYELLEKLIGCEDLYKSISQAIKQKKDEAVRTYEALAAGMDAYQKEIIPEEELPGFSARIAELEASEQKNKEELKRMTEAVAWYAADEKHAENIAAYSRAFDEANKLLEEGKEDSERLHLHDATLPAVAIYREMKRAEGNAGRLVDILKKLRENIAAKEAEVRKEEEESLLKLKKVVVEAAELFEQRKPHINKAREIKTRIDSLEKSLLEKMTLKKEASEALGKADRELEENSKNIIKASDSLRKSKENQEALEKQRGEEQEKLNRVAEEALNKYEEKNKELSGIDAVKLQRQVAEAEKTLATLKEAVRNQKELADRRADWKRNDSRQKNLENRNSEIKKELEAFDIGKLSDELVTLERSYTLMTAESWREHRAALEDGTPCLLCGATEHPYHDPSAVEPVISGMKSLLDEKRAKFKQMQQSEQLLQKEKAANEGELVAIDRMQQKLVGEIDALALQWKEISAIHADWEPDAEVLEGMIPSFEKRVEDSALEFKKYNELAKSVEEHRKERDNAEKRRREYEKDSVELLRNGERKIAEANTLLEKEKGKTLNLQAQKVEKSEAFKAAVEAESRVKDEISANKENLKQEIGERNPDAYEKELAEAVKTAEKAVADKAEAIARMREELTEMKGKEEAVKTQKEEETATSRVKKEELRHWLSNFNTDKTCAITEETVEAFSSAEDDWERIRARLKELTQSFTSAQTTLANERKAHLEHQTSKPEQPKELLLERRAELERFSNAELVDAKARMQRHEKARRAMGTMFAELQAANRRKQEWEEINDAIGSEGKTLRKIAQCYTLRFLIEHANAEIRKFNSRYELQQVKNSLGIRVIDHDRADDVRDTTSLSGGETFIVSLGLALGLSSLSSRNVSFSHLFIDEGFGTLDPDTLATVIDSLAMLQNSQGKKVGVISHTDTMSERITTQIRILKNAGTGSSRLEIHP